MADREVPDQGQLLDLNIGVLEWVGAGEVVLHFVLDIAVHTAFHEQAGTSELRAVANPTELRS